MMFAAARQIIVFAWQSFWRNFWLSVVTVSIIILALISINFLIILNVITDTALSVVKEKVDVSVYFRQEVTEPEVLEVQTFLSSLAEVQNINYISRQEALQAFRERHQADTLIIESLEELDDNPLGATLVIKAKEIEDYPAIIEVLDNSRYTSLIADRNFEDNKSYISAITTFSKNVNTIGLVTSLIFIAISALIVFNTIRVTIYTHRQEINIMKLVGATNWFIRSPFLVESTLYGIVATILGIGLLYPLLNLAQPFMSGFFLNGEFNLVSYFTDRFWQIFGLELLAVILLTILSSSVAIRRYLKV